MYYPKLWLLIVFSFICEIATDIYVSALPSLAREFLVSEKIVNLTIIVHLVGFAIGQPICGFISDKIGRYPVLFWCAILFFISTLFCALAPTPFILISSRFFQGIGACGGPVIALAVIKDQCNNSPHTVKLYSLMMVILSLAPIIGPLTGIVILKIFSWRFLFFFLAALIMITLPFLYISKKTIPMEELQNQTPSIQTSFKRILKLKFFSILLCNAFLVAIVWLFIVKVPYIIQLQFDLDIVYFGIAQLLVILGYMIGNVLSNRCSPNGRNQWLLQAGLGCIGFGCFGMFIFWMGNNLGFKLLVSFFMVFEVGLGLIRPHLIFYIMEFYQKQNGVSSSMINFFEMISGGFVIFISSQFNYNYLASFVISITFLVILSLLTGWHYFLTLREIPQKI